MGIVLRMRDGIGHCAIQSLPTRHAESDRRGHVHEVVAQDRNDSFGAWFWYGSASASGGTDGFHRIQVSVFGDFGCHHGGQWHRPGAHAQRVPPVPYDRVESDGAVHAMVVSKPLAISDATVRHFSGDEVLELDWFE